jgi:predicted DsbA family dithiol-disulfide isomerase
LIYGAQPYSVFKEVINSLIDKKSRDN